MSNHSEDIPRVQPEHLATLAQLVVTLDKGREVNPEYYQQIAMALRSYLYYEEQASNIINTLYGENDRLNAVCSLLINAGATIQARPPEPDMTRNEFLKEFMLRRATTPGSIKDDANLARQAWEAING